MFKFNIYNYLLEDKKGPYGITLRQKKTKSGHPRRLIYRPDKIERMNWNGGALFHTVPTHWHPRTFEEEFLRYIRRIKQTRVIKKCGDGVLSNEQKSYIGRNFNVMIKQCLKYADIDSLHTVYRFHFSLRKDLYYAICKHGIRAKQLMESFPYLAIRIYTGIYKDEARICDVENGLKLKNISDWMQYPLILKKLKPQSAFFYHYRNGNSMDLISMLSNKTWEQLKQVIALQASGETSIEFKKWCIKNINNFTTAENLRNRIQDFADWSRTVDFNQNMSFRRVEQLSNEWHRGGGGGRNYTWNPDVEEDFSVKSWFDEIVIDGYKFTPLISRQDLVNESAEMGHCVATYCKKVRDGRSGIFSVSNGKKLATLELIKETKWSDEGYTPEATGSVRLNQLRGPKNIDVENEIKMATYKFIGIINSHNEFNDYKKEAFR